VEVYTSQDLQALPARNLAEALNYMPGVDIQNDGPLGQPASVSIRGSDSRQVLVMIDGIPFNTQLSGQANLSKIPITDVERVEVIKGGASSVWGASLGGVINVITKSPGTTTVPQGHLTTSFGQFDTTQNSLDLNGKLGNLSYSTFGSYLNAHGNLADSRTREIKNYTKLNYDFNQTTSVNASFGYSGAHLIYGPTPTGYMFNMPYVSRYGQVQLKVDKGENVFTAAYKLNDQVITSNQEIIPTDYNIFANSHDLYQGVSVNDVYKFSNDQILTTGLDSDWHVLKSSSYLTRSEGVHSQAPYANLLWRVQDWDFIPAVRFDDNSYFGSQLSPGFGVVYHVPGWEEGLVRVKASRVFSAPPLMWLYNNSSLYGVVPNPDLKAERANMYEIGTEGNLFVPGLKGQLNLYRSDVNDAISLARVDPVNYLYQERNFEKFVRQGGEVRLDYAMTKRWSVFTAADFNDVRNEQTHKIVRGDPGMSRESFKGGSSYVLPFGLKVALEGRYNRWSSDPGQANDRKPIFDLKLTQDFKNIRPGLDLEIFFNVYNLTNSSYWSDPTFPLPGRNVEGGVTVSF
jgi:vitamin B12 transporter